MSELVFIPDHSDQAVGRLISQYKEKPRIEGFLRAFVDPFQPLEAALIDLIINRWVYTAVGAQLDVLGVIVDEPRGGRMDQEYRIAIIAKIAINNSKGTPEEVISIFGLLTASTDILLQEYFPGVVWLSGNGNFQFDYTNVGPDAFAFAGGVDGLGFGDYFDPSVGGVFNSLILKNVGALYAIMDSVLAAGVRLDELIQFDDPAFSFAGDVNGAGFGDYFDTSVGGKFASIIVP